ncbi:type II toxin-antitoxin system VapC family toxin [Corticibacterium sp. UT-5YL-CI-8]|nr:type II toxin-antitoxin system VapC family toxin [Tianweitania sp. UT-5YL-CI-8]
MFLIDTMVLSEGFKPNRDANAIAWLEANADKTLFLSVLSVGEIARGIRKIEDREPQRAGQYRRWLDSVLADYDANILPLTVPIMKRWGVLTFEVGNTAPDLLIAATALEHNLTLVTRNIRDVQNTGVKLLNPYDDRS